MSDGDAERWITSVASRLGAVEAYRPRRYDGDVVLVRAADGAATDGSDPTLGWSRCVAGKLTLEWVPGSHYSMVKGDGARAIAAIVEKHV